MYNGIGLQTARGSGTNGYVQTNRFFIRSKTNKVSNKGFESGQGTAGVSRGPNKEILEHDCKRQIELKLLVLEEKLSEQGYTDAEIAEKLDEARISLEAKDNEDGGEHALVTTEKFSETQTHQIAARKEKQMETLKAALGIESEADKEKKRCDAEAADFEADLEDGELRSIHKKDAPDGKDTRDEKDDVRKVAKKNASGRDTSKPHNKGKNRRHEDSSDSDSIVNLKKGSSRKDLSRKKEVVRHASTSDSESQSESESDSGSESDHVKKYRKARRQYDSSNDSSSDESLKNRKQTLKKTSKSRRYDSDDDTSGEDRTCKNKISKSTKQDRYDKHSKHYGSDDDSSGENRARKSKISESKQKGPYNNYSSDDEARHHQKVKKIQKSSKLDSDNEYNSDDKTQKSKGLSKSRRHDSDDELYADRYAKDERSQYNKRSNHTHRHEKSTRDNRRKIRSEIQGKVSGRYGHESETDSDEATKKKRQRDEDELNADSGRQDRNNRRNRKYDFGEDDIHKSDESIERNRGTDTKRARVEEMKSLVEKRGVRSDDSGARGGKKDYLHESDHKEKQKTKDDGSNTFKKLEQLLSGVKKVDDERWDGQSEGKSRRRDLTKETENEVLSERESKPYKNKEYYSKDNKRDDCDYENHGRSTRERRDIEEESYRRNEKERSCRKDERDSEYSSKRARYDEARSSGRRYDDDRNDERRSRR